jgi:energy-coupling factor transporter ATPase
MPPLIAVENLSFHYPGEKDRPLTLKDVTFEVNPGEFIAILGANGSGKTTLARHLNGLLVPDQGRVLVNGIDTRERKFHGKISQQIGMVFQYPEDQIVATTVEEDVAFGPENLGLETSRIRRRVDEAIAAVGLEAHRNRPPHLLSAGQLQRLALAGVLAMRPRCVVFDEATTMLDPAGRRMAHELMKSLLSEGLSVVFVTHDMEEAALSNRVIVLQQGEVVFDGPPSQAFANDLLHSWGLEPPPAIKLARILSDCIPEIALHHLTMDDLLATLPSWKGDRPNLIVEQDALPGGPAVIAVRELEHIYLEGTPLAHPALLGIDLNVSPDRAHGLAGVTGSGKSTVLQHLNGLLRPQKGSVRVGEYFLEDLRVLTRDVVKQAGLVFQNPELQFFEMYVGDEIAFGLRQMGWNGSLRGRVREAMETVGLDFEQLKDRPVHTLSGGEKRKVALASILANQTPILLLDEPTAGLDPQSHTEILAHLQNLRDQGKQLVVSSHRMDDLAELVQDLTVFRKGTSLFSGRASDLFQQSSELYAAGLEPPSAARAATRLREMGWPLPPGLVTAGKLREALQACKAGAS